MILTEKNILIYNLEDEGAIDETRTWMKPMKKVRFQIFFNIQFCFQSNSDLKTTPFYSLFHVCSECGQIWPKPVHTIALQNFALQHAINLVLLFGGS